MARAIRRALAIAMALGDSFAETTALAELKGANLAGSLPRDRAAEFSELLAAQSLLQLHVTANALSYLLSSQMGELTVDPGDAEEILTDNAPLALQGMLWELDQKLATFATGEEEKLVPTLTGYAALVMEKTALRADSHPHLGAFTAATWRIEADDLTIRGFTPRLMRNPPSW